MWSHGSASAPGDSAVEVHADYRSGPVKPLHGVDLGPVERAVAQGLSRPLSPSGYSLGASPLRP